MSVRLPSELRACARRALPIGVLALCLILLPGCRAAAPVATPPATMPTAAAPTAPSGLTVVEPDEAYYDFGVVLPVQMPDPFWRYDPHSVAVYSVQLCRQGDTARLLEQLRYVEQDAARGEAFARFVEVFGPDLERYQSTKISLRFVGVRQGQEVSVWYYALLDDQGQPLDDHSWLSVHRSKVDGRCALAGVFVNEFGEQPVYMPEDLITSR